MPFQKGMSGNPNGRPTGSRNKIARFRQAIMEKYSVEDIQAVLNMVFQEANKGDIGAAKVFLEYILPKADKCMDMDIEENKQELTLEQALAIRNILEPDQVH